MRASRNELRQNQEGMQPIGTIFFDQGGGHLIPAEFDNEKATDLLANAYQTLTTKIHETIQTAHQQKKPSIVKEVVPNLYIDGVTRRYRNKYTIGNPDREVGFISDYFKEVGQVYRNLVYQAVEKEDFSFVISTVDAFQESDLARHILDTLGTEKIHLPDAVMGNAGVAFDMVHNHNDYISEFKGAAKTYAVEKAKETEARNLRRKLNDEKTGMLGALAIGLRSKFDRVSARKAMKEHVYRPLEIIAALPNVPDQLIAKEQASLSILED